MKWSSPVYHILSKAARKHHHCQILNSFQTCDNAILIKAFNNNVRFIVECNTEVRNPFLKQDFGIVGSVKQLYAKYILKNMYFLLLL